jgi:hypothetical protein
MAFDPDLDVTQTESHLRKQFGSSARPARYRIPGSLEPELKNILPDNDLSTFRNFYNYLHTIHSINVLPQLHTNKNMLISLREDTAAQDIAKAGFMRRRRADFNLSNAVHPFSQFDESAKDLLPNAKVTPSGLRLRREWEAHAFGKGLHFSRDDLQAVLGKGYETFTQISDLPDVMKTTEESQLRVSSAIITSRASYHLIHHMPDLNAAMSYEVCNDCCLITTPHGDIRVAKRTELELEIKDIYFAGQPLDEQGIEKLIVESMHRMNEITYASGLNFFTSEESKMEQADRAVAAYYEQHGMTASVTNIAGAIIQDGHLNGTQYALLQDVTAQSFLQHTNQLGRIARALPLPRQIIAEGSNGQRSCQERRKNWLNLPSATAPTPVFA